MSAGLDVTGGRNGFSHQVGARANAASGGEVPTAAEAGEQRNNARSRAM